MLASWVRDEMKTTDLNDKRLNERLSTVLSQLSSQPSESIPLACGGRNEMVAAYRFFDNEKCSFENILQPHMDATLERMATQQVVVLASDSSEIDVTRPQSRVSGAGPLDHGARWGALLHLLEAFTPDGTPLGGVGAKSWTRDNAPSKNSSLTHAQRLGRPIEEKESYRWLEMHQHAQEVARLCPSTRCIHVADSEADIYELLDVCQAGSADLDWVIRACQDRVLAPKTSSETGERQLLHAQALQAEVLATHTISVRGRTAKIPKEKEEQRSRNQTRESREAIVSIRATSVTLRPPYRADRKFNPLTINVVLVREDDPPGDEEPVEWLLLTNLPIVTIEQVRQVIQYYSVRWMIEVYFRTLKTGCRVEERLFEQIDRVLNCLAVYMIVAWRVLYVCRLARSSPDISCEAVFEPAEWQAVWTIVKKIKLPKQPPKLLVMLKIVARLGGYVERPKSLPGPQTVWIGLQRAHDITNCWLSFGPGKQAIK